MRTLRAVLWLRWRLAYNGLRSGVRRGRLEKLSRAVDILVPLMLVFMILPTSIATSLLGFFGGWYLGAGPGAGGKPESLLAILVVLRVLLGGLTLMTLLIPLVRSVRGMGGNFTRFLLLPMSPGILHAAELASTFTDPWIIIVTPALLAIPVGMAAAGAFPAAGLVLLAGLAFLLVLASLGTLATTLLHLMFRNRRRGEWITLVVTLLLSCSGILWMLFVNGPMEDRLREAKQRRQAEAGTPPAGEPTQLPLRPEPVILQMPATSAVVPSELYTRIVWQATNQSLPGAALSLAGLLLLAAAAFAVSARAHRRLLETPAVSGARSAGGKRGVRLWKLPGLSASASAVATAQVRTVLRTVRGKMAVFFSPVILLLIGIVLRRNHEELEQWMRLAPMGLWVAFIGIPFSILSLQMVHLNFFAIDGAGLSLQLLSPVSDRDLARGKAAGGGILAGLTLFFFMAAALLAGPGGSPWLWACVPVGALAVYATYAPFAVLLSAIFPKSADLGRIGRGGNPHSLSGTLGILATPFVVGPPALIVALTAFWLEAPALAFLILCGYALAAGLLGLLGVTLASRAVGTRRENLALVASGR